MVMAHFLKFILERGREREGRRLWPQCQYQDPFISFCRCRLIFGLDITFWIFIYLSYGHGLGHIMVTVVT